MSVDHLALALAIGGEGSGTFVQLSSEEKAFEALASNLKCAGRITMLNLKEAFYMDSPSMLTDYAKTYARKSSESDGYAIQGYVRISDIPGLTPEDVCSKGVEALAKAAKENGIPVRLNNISYLCETTTNEESVPLDFLIVHAYVKNPLCKKTKSVEENFVEKSLPTSGGFDSFYIRSPESEDLGVPEGRDLQGTPSSLPAGVFTLLDAKREEGFWRHKLIVFDASMVCPLFYVRGTSYPAKESVKLNECVNIKCDSCKEEEPVVWCDKCQFRFCIECDAQIHSHKLLNATHERSALTLENTASWKVFNSEQIKCEIHTKRDAEFYCDLCKKTLCVECKMMGSHSKAAMCHILGPLAEHPIRLLSSVYLEAFSKVSDAAMDDEGNKNKGAEDGDASDYRTALLRYREELRSLSKSISQNERMLLEEIQKKAETLAYHAREVTRTKLNLVNSETSMVSRKIEELDWSRSYVEYASQIFNPVSFLHTFNQMAVSEFEVAAKGMKQLKEHPPILPTTANIRLEGDIYVEVDDSDRKVLNLASDLARKTRRSGTIPTAEVSLEDDSAAPAVKKSALPGTGIAREEAEERPPVDPSSPLLQRRVGTFMYRDA